MKQLLETLTRLTPATALPIGESQKTYVTGSKAGWHVLTSNGEVAKTFPATNEGLGRAQQYVKLYYESLQVDELDEGYSEDDIAIGGTVIYKKDGIHQMSKACHKTATKVHTKSGHEVPMHHIVSTDASDWDRFKNVKESIGESKVIIKKKESDIENDTDDKDYSSEAKSAQHELESLATKKREGKAVKKNESFELDEAEWTHKG